MNDIYFWLLLAGTIASSIFFAYQLGKSNERENNEKNRSDSLSVARHEREALLDPIVSERLHAKYKR